MEWDETDPKKQKDQNTEFKYLYEMPHDQSYILHLHYSKDFVENKSKRKLFIAGNYLPNLPNEKHGIGINYQHGVN